MMSKKRQEWLRVKGMASADKKQGRIAAEGVVIDYIHAGSRIGVLCEVNCETDFVARGDKFKELAKDVAMQIAACPEVEYISASDCDPTMIVARKREIEMKKEDLQSKPENIREKIVQGRIDKMVNEKALLPKDYIKDTSKTVEELIKEATAELGEKISIRRREIQLGRRYRKESLTSRLRLPRRLLSRLKHQNRLSRRKKSRRMTLQLKWLPSLRLPSRNSDKCPVPV